MMHLKGVYKKLNRKNYTIAAVLWTILIIVLSVMSAMSLNRINVFDFIGIDKIGHVVFYTVLSFFWSGVFSGMKNAKVFIIFLCTSFGFLLEILQFYVFIGRSFEYYDALANLIGVLFGVILFNKVQFK